MTPGDKPRPPLWFLYDRCVSNVYKSNIIIIYYYCQDSGMTADAYNSNASSSLLADHIPILLYYYSY